MNRPEYRAFVENKREHIESAAKYPSAAEVGKPVSLAALAAHNQKATQSILKFLEDARDVVTKNSKRLNSCKGTPVTADSYLHRRVFNKSGIKSSYQEA